MSLIDLKNKTALITGGGTGIGRAIAQAFVDAGAKVVISGRREQPLADAAHALGASASYHAFDVSELPALPGAVAAIEQKVGPLDILVNTAGINLQKPALELTDEEFNRIVQANLNGLFALTREVARGMADRQAGAVLNITSMAALYGLPKVAAYSASKTAVLGLTQQLAVEFAPLGIRVNAIAPGFIFSEMTAKALDADPERKARVLARTPMGRMGRADEVASAAVYLCSDAASFITGVNLPVDGGNSIGF
ncbi:MAG: SDR family NAD(P)-dependent oxidoreductase [Tepidisphaeraceae bacterium]